jgi:2,3-bisphosphoglycerate-independent phosphoglycerate mutase
MKTIEDFDARLIGRVMKAAGENIAYAVLPDHPVPLTTGKHTRTPVPVAVWQPRNTPDTVQTFDEIEAPKGSLGLLKGSDLMDLLLAR